MNFAGLKLALATKGGNNEELLLGEAGGNINGSNHAGRLAIVRRIHRPLLPDQHYSVCLSVTRLLFRISRVLSMHVALTLFAHTYSSILAKPFFRAPIYEWRQK